MNQSRSRPVSYTHLDVYKRQDHGLTMSKIAKAISAAAGESEGDIQAMLDDAAMAVMVLNGGSAVPLWNTWLCLLYTSSFSTAGLRNRSGGPLFLL